MRYLKSINEYRQFENIDMIVVSSIFKELSNKYSIEIQYGPNFIKLIKSPSIGYDVDTLEKDIDYTLFRALTYFYDETDLKIFYFLSPYSFKSFLKNYLDEDQFLWIYYDFYDPTLVSNYKYRYKVYSI